MNELLSIFKALSGETRLRIIKLLEKGELCMRHIAAAAHMPQPKISFHLKVVKEAWGGEGQAGGQMNAIPS